MFDWNLYGIYAKFCACKNILSACLKAFKVDACPKIHVHVGDLMIVMGVNTGGFGFGLVWIDAHDHRVSDRNKNM